MEIKDVDGRKIPLYFYTDGRDSELAPAQVQRGYTVAILYAQRHAFVFCEPGIRHEDPRMIKVPQQLPIYIITANERHATQINFYERHATQINFNEPGATQIISHRQLTCPSPTTFKQCCTYFPCL